MENNGRPRLFTDSNKAQAQCMLDDFRLQTHSSEYLTLIDFPLQQLLRERPSILRLYVYSLSFSLAQLIQTGSERHPASSCSVSKRETVHSARAAQVWINHHHHHLVPRLRKCRSVVRPLSYMNACSSAHHRDNCTCTYQIYLYHSNSASEIRLVINMINTEQRTGQS